MLLGVIKRYETLKCTRIAVQKTGFFENSYYEARIYTTQARKTVPQDDAELKIVSRQIIDANWVQEDYREYTHRAKLKDYPHLTINIKKINKPTLEDFQANEGDNNE